MNVSKSLDNTRCIATRERETTISQRKRKHNNRNMERKNFIEERELRASRQRYRTFRLERHWFVGSEKRRERYS